jgi:prophage antirepressor-like protein
MSDLQPFSFEGIEVRFVGTVDVPEWVGADIVSVLYPDIELKNRSTYLRGIPTEWKGLQKVQTLGGDQDMVTVFEAGLYSLIARSNSPLAVPFQKWVYEEVLPSIRKTGSYSVGQSSSPRSALPSAKEKLENIRLGLDLLYELGGTDERTTLALKDIVRDKLKKPALPSGGRAEWPVSDRARHLGYKPIRKDLTAIGRTAAKLYRLRHDGENPPEREQFVDGTTRMVKCYGEADLDILDQAITLVMDRPSPLPESEDPSEKDI